MIELGRNGVRATIARSGGLRRLSVAGRELIVAPALGEPNPAYHGELLAPWPNRVGEGRYRFGGVDHQLRINEVAHGHAIHGFVSGLRWHAQRRESDGVALASVLDEQPGYPFRLVFTVDYDLRDDGISARLHARNVGDAPAPVGLGSHPYVKAGDAPLDSWELTLDSETLLGVDSETLLPAGVQHVAETPFDFRSPRPVGDLRFSRAFRLEAEPRASSTTVTLRDPGGGGVKVVLGATSRWVQIYTGDVEDLRLRRRGLAVEPMTCPPNAFASGRDLDILDPGDHLELSWEIRAI